MSFAEWIGLVAGVLVAAAGGNWIGDWLAARNRTSHDVVVAHVEDVRSASSALVRYSGLVFERRETGDPSLDEKLRRAGDELEASVAMIRSKDLGPLTRDYVQLAERLAGGDPDLSEAKERASFRALLSGLRAERLVRVARR